LKPQKVA